MSFEPKNFFIGLMDFFSILMPGALLTYYIGNHSWQCLFHNVPMPDGTQGWIVFLFSSYLLGHFVFLVGAALMDECVYEKIRNATFYRQVKRIVDGENLSSRLLRFLAKYLIKKDSDKGVLAAIKIKKKYLDSLNASSSINAFQWCKAKLSLENPAAFDLVQRFEADSKFFRSLFVVLIILIPYAICQREFAFAGIGALLIGFAFWRYVDQRVKSTNQAYWYIITLEGNMQQRWSEADTITHAGGVVFRTGEKEIEYLIVQAKKDPGQWVLPKGHIEDGEDMKETAVREVREETGVWARVIKKLEPAVNFKSEDNKKDVNVLFYLMEFHKEEKPMEKRQCLWLTLEHAQQKLSFKDTQDLLALADQKIKEKPKQ
jgi:8-oxo-dGTP pyrophosphatase MutT (NUDIX family)